MGKWEKNQRIRDSAEFSLSSELWRTYLGFQRSEPLSDFRGGGRLSAEAILYFSKSPRGKQLQAKCLRRRASAIAAAGGNSDDTYDSYPLAPAIINMVRHVASLLNVCDAYGRDTEFCAGSLYDLAKSQDSFFECVIDGMEIIDDQFLLVNGGYMAFPEVQKRSYTVLREFLLLRCEPESEQSNNNTWE